MNDHFEWSDTQGKRYRCGPIGQHLDGFANLLSEQGYSKQVGLQKIRVTSLLSRWLARNRVGIRQLDEQRIAEFLRTQRRALRRQRQVEHTLDQLLRHFRRSEIIPEPRPPRVERPSDLLMFDYQRFLTEERGLSQATSNSYLPVARRLLAKVSSGKALGVGELTARDIHRFILRDSSHISPKRLQLIASALRSFLGFLHLRGQIALPLGSSIPSVAAWRLSELPKFLETEQVRRLVRSCDRNSPGGRRDFAALLLLARLGLRAGEVVHLSLEDIDWSSGAVLIRGKGSREDRLPLPPDVGRALASYLKNGRPRCSSRRVFIRMKAPHVGFSSSVAICDIVRRALIRTGLEPEHKGAHVLRHSLAVQMLRGGASLTQIGQILRHQLPQTTEIYAKVDLTALRAVAQPWPGGAR
jgi:site-specific recombinase XerD